MTRYTPPKMRKDRWFSFLLKGFSLKRKKLNQKPKQVGSRRKNNPLKGVQRKWYAKNLSRGIAVGFVALIIIFGCGHITFKLIAGSNIFDVYTIDIKGNSNIPDREIHELAQVDQGSNLLNINLKKVETTITSHNWLESVQVKRRFPSTIEITVKEHSPLGLVNIEKNKKLQLHYFDRQGKIFAPAQGKEDIDFPVITGIIAQNEAKNLRFNKDSQAGMALQFLKLASGGNAILPLQAISEINIHPQYGLIAYLTDRPFPIFLGKENIKNRYYQLVKIFRQLYKNKKVEDIAKIQLNYAENKVLVTMVEPNKL